jgi:hypothetical protein
MVYTNTYCNKLASKLKATIAIKQRFVGLIAADSDETSGK